MRTMNSASLLCVCVVCVVSSLCFGFAGGDGSAGDPWQIETIADLEAVNGDPGACYILNCNIDLSGETYTDAVIAPPIHYYSPDFTGSFDGNGFSIIGLTINSTERHVGLFGETNGSEIMNLGIENCDITGDNSVGGLVGYNYGSITNCYSIGTVSGDYSVGSLVGVNDGIITNCYSKGNVSGTGNYGSVGDLVGGNGGIITNCYSTGTVSGTGGVGGMVGHNYGSITNCYSKGNVSGTGNYVGGLVAFNYYYGSITNCYSKGNVSGTGDYVGGLVGYNDAIITNCYSTGTVSGTGNYFGGFCGYQLGDDAEMENCFWDVDTSGQTVGYNLDSSEPGTVTNVVGKTTAEMMTQSTFTDAGWDFVGESVNSTNQTWQMHQGGGYPELTFLTGAIPHQLQGDGTELNPYLIGDANDLGAVCYYPNACFKQTADIDLEGIWWVTAIVPVFNGTFDGNGYVIGNMSIDGTNYVGLFGCLGLSAVVSDLVIQKCNIIGNSYVSGLVGWNYSCSITNCYSTGTVSGTGDYVGGLVGWNEEGSVTNCCYTGDVSGTGDYVGGLVGYNRYSNNSSITNCYSTGTVSGTGNSVGGLVGYNLYGSITDCYSTGTVSGTSYSVGGLVGNNVYICSITNCYSTGTVSGTGDYVGGLVGRNGDSCSITNCYSTGTVGGTGDYVGGMVGSNRYGSITNCYSTGTVSGTGNYWGGFCGYQLGDDAEMRNCFWDVDTSGQTVGYNLDSSEPGTVTNVVGKTTAEMMTQSTFTDAGWDFSSADGDEADWFMAWDGYPIFPWQISPADIYPDGNNNLKDFALFARYWMCENCGVYNYYCEFADLDFDGDVDANDLIYIADYWLEGK